MITLSLSKKGPIINWLIKNKIVKSVAFANVFLLLVIVASLTTTFFVNKSAFASPQEKLTYLEDISEEIRQTLPPEILKQIPSRNAQK